MAIDVISLATAVGAGLAVVGVLLGLQALVRTRRMREELKGLEEARRVAFTNEQVIQGIVDRALELENGDMRMALIRLIIEMEAGLRRVARKLDMEPEKVHLDALMNTLRRSGQIPKQVESAFKFIWETRNKAVHGLEITDKELKGSLQLAAALLLAFKEIWPDFFAELPTLP